MEVVFLTDDVEGVAQGGEVKEVRKDMYKDLMTTGKRVDVPNKNFNLNPPDLSEVNQIKDWLRWDFYKISREKNLCHKIRLHRRRWF